MTLLVDAFCADEAKHKALAALYLDWVKVIKASGKTHDFSRGMKASHTGWFRKFSRSCREYTPDRCINQVWQLKDGKEA
jgi:hypothetical protein